MIHKCCMPDCLSDSHNVNESVSFFRLPRIGKKNGERYIKWRLQIIDTIRSSDERFDPNTAEICSLHFEPECFKYNKNGHRSLVFGCLPTKLLKEKSIVTQETQPSKEPVHLEDVQFESKRVDDKQKLKRTAVPPVKNRNTPLDYRDIPCTVVSVDVHNHSSPPDPENVEASKSSHFPHRTLLPGRLAMDNVSKRSSETVVTLPRKPPDRNTQDSSDHDMASNEYESATHLNIENMEASTSSYFPHRTLLPGRLAMDNMSKRSSETVVTLPRKPPDRNTQDSSDHDMASNEYESATHLNIENMEASTSSYFPHRTLLPGRLAMDNMSKRSSETVVTLPRKPPDRNTQDSSDHDMASNEYESATHLNIENMEASTSSYFPHRTLLPGRLAMDNMSKRSSETVVTLPRKPPDRNTQDSSDHDMASNEYESATHLNIDEIQLNLDDPVNGGDDDTDGQDMDGVQDGNIQLNVDDPVNGGDDDTDGQDMDGVQDGELPLDPDNAESEDDAPNICTVCHRQSTEYHPLILRPLNAELAHNHQLKRRQYGDRHAMRGGQLACEECTEYICPPDAKLANTPTWNCAWPSVIWSALSVQHFVPVLLFLQFLAYPLRLSWQHDINHFTAEIQNLWATVPYFSEQTLAYHKFIADIRSGSLIRLQKALNSHPYPTARCPIGCSIYMDDIDEEDGQDRYLSAKHYFQLMNPNFKSFKCDKHYFDGARPDWIIPKHDLDWTIQPTLFVHETEGLSIIVCSKNQHANGKSKYLFPPPNPAMPEHPYHDKEFLAPATMTAQVEKQPRINAYTSSSPVFRQSGSTAGLSTMRLSVGSMKVTYDDNLIRSAGFTVLNRPDVHEYVMQSENPNFQHMPEVIRRYLLDSIPENDIAKSKEAASFIAIEDAFLASKMHNDRYTDDDRNDNIKLNDFYIPIYNTKEYGHMPIPVPRGKITRHQLVQPLSYDAYALASMIIHVRQIHYDFVKKLWSQDNLPIHRIFGTCCKRIWNLQNVPVAEMLNMSEAVVQLRQHAEPHRIVQHVLGSVVLTEQLQEIPNVMPQTNANIVSIAREQELQPLPPAPYEILDEHERTWYLILGLTIQPNDTSYTAHIAFRWMQSLLWQYTGTNAHEIDANIMGLLIYVNDNIVQDARREIMKRTGGQCGVSCINHDKLLIRERIGTQIECSVHTCSAQVRWRCPYGLSEIQCTVGLCIRHMKERLGDNAEQYIGNYGPALPNPLNHDAVNEVIVDERPEQDENVLLNIFGYQNNHADQGSESYNVVLGSNDFPDPELPMSTAPVDSYAFLDEDSVTSTSGHFFLNNYLGLMARRTKKGNVPVATQKLLQDIVVSTPTWTVPLLYPEGQLFPSIFWSMHGPTIVGALPAVSFTRNGQQKVANLASMKDHFRVRLNDTTSLTSRRTDYIQFMADVNINAILQHESPTIVSQRGLEHVTRGKHHMKASSNEPLLHLDEPDGRTQVRRLEAQLKSEGAWSYFVTLTCNDNYTMGVKPIRRAILAQCKCKSEEQTRLTMDSYQTLLCRAWYRTSRYLWEFIVCSPERPLGHVKAAFMRYEFQSAGAIGNKPHLHGGLTLYEEPEQVTLNRIRCSSKDLFDTHFGTDFFSLKNDGFVDSFEDYCEIINLAEMLQKHSCANGNHRCLKRTRDDTFVCRVQRHPPSFEYSYIAFDHIYDQETLQRLRYLDLGYLDGMTGKWKPPQTLTGKRWQYPAQPNEHFVPTSARLFLASLSSTNVQMCDEKFQVSYLAKYAAGSDEKSTVEAKQQDDASIRTNTNQLYNHKITGQRVKQKDMPPLLRQIPFTEMVWFSENFLYVVSTCDFTHVSTYPPEYRTVILKQRVVPNQVDGGAGMPQSERLRLALPPERHFTRHQLMTIGDLERSKYTCDLTTAFSIRPPELFGIIMSLHQYCQWFVLGQKADGRHDIPEAIQESPLRDGLDRIVKIRMVHLEDLINHLHRIVNDQNHEARLIAQNILENICQPLQQLVDLHDFTPFVKKFVDVTKTKRNVIVFSQITADSPTRFFVHMMLSLSDNLMTEIDLYSQRNYRDSLVMSGLIPDHPTEDDVKRLLKMYVEKDLQWLPISARRFSALLKKTIDAVRGLCLDDNIVYDGLPLCLEREMRNKNDLLIDEQLRERRRRLVEVLSQANIPDMPSEEDLINHQPVEFRPQIVRDPYQTEQSFIEQEAALARCVQAVDQLLEPQRNHAYSLILVGPPGAGKTHILMIASAYALSKQLNVQITALTSERARKMGGEHVHLLFAIPVLQHQSVTNLAEHMMISLARNATKIAILQRLDVLFIDEIGLLSAELVAAFDIVLRHVRDNDKPLGGLLFVATGDPHQLRPVDGSMVWNSHLLVATFRIVHFQHYVRAQRDQNLQRILSILRQTEVTEDDVQDYVGIIRDCCIPRNTLPSWEAVPDHVIRVVGTKKAAKEITANVIARKKREMHIVTYEFEARDTIQTTNGREEAANNSIRGQIDYQCPEPRCLTVWVDAIMRLTHNNVNATANTPRYSQGQLVVITNIIPGDTPTIRVKIFPPTVRNIEHMDQWDTPEFNIKQQTSPIINLRRNHQKAYRYQFPLAYYCTTTVHKSIGETYETLATQISLQNKTYNLWEKEQLLVIFSRVRDLNSLLFVTVDFEDTINAMVSLLRQNCDWLSYINQNLRALEYMNHDVIPIQRHFEAIPDMVITDRYNGFVYMIISTKDARYGYVGETKSIRERLQQHNRGQGSDFTRSPHLRPWSLYLLIQGFPFDGSHPENIRSRKAVEARWHQLNGGVPQHQLDVYRMATHGQQVARHFKPLFPYLTIETYGRLLQ